MSDRSRIVVVGSHAPGLFIRVKRPPRLGETVIGWDFQEPVDGGKGSNQAIAVARLGAPVSFVGVVGQDRIGDEGDRWMSEAGVDTSFLRRSSTESSGIGFILLDENGVPAMVTTMGANKELSCEEIDQALDRLDDASVMLTQFEIDIEIALQAARSARERGLTAIVNPAPAPEEPVKGLEAASILTPNETEAKVLLGLDPEADIDPSDMVKKLREATGVPVVIITVGEGGAVGMDELGIWHSKAPKVEVTDTSGAGDVFCAALAVGLIRGMDIRSASNWACLAAAVSVTKPGTIPAFPTLQAVEQFAADIVI
jgi:ribokinase